MRVVVWKTEWGTRNAHICDICKVRITFSPQEDKWIYRVRPGTLVDRSESHVEILDICPHCADRDRPRFSYDISEITDEVIFQVLDDMRGQMIAKSYHPDRLQWRLGMKSAHRIKSLPRFAFSNQIEIMGIAAIEDVYIPEDRIVLELKA